MTDDSLPLNERLTLALADCKTVLDETDLRHVVEAVLPVCLVHGHDEYDRGMESGDYFARRKIARRLGLGEVQS